MLPRWVTAAYLAYLGLPIALLVVGSFGDLWLNTLLPTGGTLRWYATGGGRWQLPPRLRREPLRRSDGLRGMRRDRAAARLRGLPRRERARARGRARPLSAAGRAACAGARVRLHPRVLVGHAAVARQRLAARRRPHRARPSLFPADRRRRHAAPRLARARGCGRVARRQRTAAIRAHRAARAAPLGAVRTHRRRGAVDWRVPVLEPGRGLPQSHLSGRAAAGVLRRDRLRLRGDGRCCSRSR